MIRESDRLPLFPDSTTVQDNLLKIDGQDLTGLAERFGTPLYVYDRATMDAAVARYKASLRAHYPAAAAVTYAGKAFLCRAITDWAGQQGIEVDCSGAGEIAIAVASKLPPSRIVVHGVNKSSADLESAMAHAGTIVVDNLTELKRVARLFRSSDGTLGEGGARPSLWLRLQPGTAVQTHHAYTQTGQSHSKFGMTRDEVAEAGRIAAAEGLALNGMHFHQGSNFRDPAPLVGAIELALRLAKEIGLTEPWHFSPGGGWGAAYHEDELPQPEIDTYVRLIAQEVSRRCRTIGLSLPTLHLEPGRSLVARAGVAVYRVESVKRRKQRTWLLIDGGMADNPRPSLYGSRYSCLPAKGLGREMIERVSIAGPFCETGDVLIEDLPMPRIEEGELIVVPMSGAYHLSMASNYNGRPRPAVVWLEHGKGRLVIRRETIEQLTQRDLSIN